MASDLYRAVPYVCLSATELFKAVETSIFKTSLYKSYECLAFLLLLS